MVYIGILKDFHWLNTSSGARTDWYRIYNSQAPLFGKANGLGDIELLCSPAPLEIGNYVWCDSLQNGIQDACERGINNILVSLYDRNGVLVGQDTTSNSGQYYFNEFNVDTTGITVNGSGIASPVTIWSGMSYSTQYFIVFGGGQFATDEFTVGSETYGITSMVNAGSNDNIDSDVDGSSLTTGSLGARPDGLPFIDMTTGATGCGDHKYDLGVTCSCTNPILTDLINETICEDGSFTATNVTIGITNGVTVAYQWYNNNGADNANINPIVGQMTATFTALPTAAGSYSYRVEATDTADNSCMASKTVTLTITNSPDISLVVSDTTVCDQTDAIPILSSSEIGFNYQLRNDADDSLIGNPVAGTGNPISFTISNLTPIGTYTYNVLATNSISGCNAEITDKAIIEVVGCDFQDYLPTCANPPCHFTSTDIYIGSGVSSEASTMGSINADSDDDDGILIPNNIRPGITIRFPTTIYNNTGQTAYLTGWIDWNGDQDFDDSGEQIANESYDTATYSGSFQVPIVIQVPSDAVQGQNIAVRYRLSTDSADIISPCGATSCAADGEIEDYLIQIECPPTICLPVNIIINRSE